MREFIPSEVTCSIIDHTPMILSEIKEGIIEICDERPSALCTEIMIKICTLMFREFRVCEASDFHGD